MSFLDDHPLDFTKPEVPQLRDLFVVAYRRRTAAEELADAAGIVPGTFPEHDNMRTTWTQLIKVMAQQDKLRTMVEKAAADPTVASYQDQFQDMLTDDIAVPTGQPTPNSDWWKGPDTNAAVARRIHLERLMEERSRLVDIGIARQVAEIARSVAKLSLRFTDEKAFGTGFLIQPNLILTNHHNVSHPDFGDLTAMTVEFDYEPNAPANALVQRGKMDSIVKNAEHDWAVVELEQPVDRAPIGLGSKFDVGPNDSVIIIQHPLGSFKKFALDPLSIQYADKNVVQYLADTQKGSSGSPVFNIQMQLIALHHAETETVVNVDGREDTVWRNEGIRIDRVMDGLRDNHVEFVSNVS